MSSVPIIVKTKATNQHNKDTLLSNIILSSYTTIPCVQRDCDVHSLGRRHDCNTIPEQNPTPYT